VVGLLALCAQACKGRPAQSPTDFAPRGDLAELELPLTDAAGACQLETLAPHVDWAAPLPLRLSAAAPPALKVSRVPARIRVSGNGAARILVDDGILELAAQAQLTDLRLYPRRPLRDEAIVLLPQALLRPLEVNGGSLRVEHSLRGPLRLPRDNAQQLEVACADLAISRGAYDAAASVALLRRLGYAYLKGRQVVTLYPDAAADAGMRLRVFLPQGQWLELALHSAPADTGRVLASYRQGAELMVGWIAAGDLELETKVPAPVSYAGAERFLIPQGIGTRRCRRPLELGVVQGASSAYVGRLRAGGGWDLAAAEEPDLDAPGLVPIHVPHASWLELLGGAQLVARAADLRRCQDPPRTAPTPKK